MARLPVTGSDNGTWGNVLNDFLAQSHNADGTLKGAAVTNAGAYSKPVSGIPKTDLASSVQGVLDNSLQTSVVGQANGVAALDATSVVPIAQLPPYPMPKQSVAVCATTNVTLSSPGAAIDGQTLSNGNRVLLVGQTSAAENGIYTFNGASSPLTRSTDANTNALLRNAFVFVNLGTQAQSGWENVTSGTITVDATPQTWVQFEAPVTASGTQLNDTSGNPVVLTSGATTPVNQLTMGNAATGANVSIVATGTDANIGMNISPKGTGITNITSTTADANLNITTTGSSKGAFISLFSTNAAFNAISGWISGSLKWRIGRSGASNGVTVYTNDGNTAAVQFDDNQNTRLRGGLWYKRTTVADVAYTAAVNDLIIAYTSLTASRTVTLPTAASVTGQVYLIKDETGTVTTNNIVVTGTGGQTIDGAVSKSINANYGGLIVYSNGTNWSTQQGGAIPYTAFNAKGDLLAGTASGGASNLGVGANGQVLTADSTQTTGVKWAAPASNVVAYPNYKSGHYYYAASPGGNNTSAPANGTVRVTPLVLTASLTVARIGMEFTAAGDAASVFRVAIWNDDGTGIPGTLVQDCGTISTGTGNAGSVATGGTPGTYEITLGTPLTLAAGVYWVGGATQGVTVTAPTLRTVSSTNVVYPISQLTTIPSAGFSSAGFLGATQTGAFGSFTTPSVTSNIPRLFFKVS